MAYFHFTARAHWGRNPFAPVSSATQRDLCVDFWHRLRDAFPKTLGCVLMPDHFHLLLETSDPRQTQHILSRLMSGFTRRFFNSNPLWNPIAPPALIPDLHHLKRQVRYVHLNPCRRGLTRDPLLWEWCTHREAVGAAEIDWLDRHTLIRALQCRPSEFATVFHAYVSSDPHAAVDGTPLPAAIPTQEIVASREAISGAILQVTRGLPQTPAHRRSVVLLGNRVGIFKKTVLAEMADVAPRSVSRILSRPATAEESRQIQAATLLLSAPERFGLRAAH